MTFIRNSKDSEERKKEYNSHDPFYDADWFIETDFDDDDWYSEGELDIDELIDEQTIEQ